MNKTELEVINKNRVISQIGFIYKDLEKAMYLWVDKLGIGPWKILTLSNDSVHDAKILKNKKIVLNNEPFKFHCAMCRVANVQIELIQPEYGKTIYDDYLKKKGEGLHHIKELIPPERWEANLNDYEKKGMPEIFSGKIGETFYAYINTEEALGFILEFGNGVSNKKYPQQTNLRYYPEK